MDNKIYTVTVVYFIFLLTPVFGQQKEVSQIVGDGIKEDSLTSIATTLSSTNIAILSNIEIRYSSLPVKELMDRLEKLLLSKGITIYARIDQQQEAAKAGLKLPELEFILFGSPKTGGALMNLNPLVGLDLPLKVIVWKEGTDRIAIAYNKVDFLANRYCLNKDVLGSVDLSGLIKQIL